MVLTCNNKYYYANQCYRFTKHILENGFNNIDKKEIRTCFNPKILKSSEETIIMTEGWLTWPGLWLKLARPYNIFCSYEDEHGEVHEVHMQDLEARVFQHEMDHMEGTNFTQRVSKLKLKMAKKRASKVKKRADRLKKAQR